MTELAPPDDGIVLASDRYLASIRSNPDTVLVARGASLDVYDELLRDDQVRSTLQQRRTAVVSAEWTVEPGGETAIDAEAADFVREQFARVNLDDKTDKMLYGLFYGWSVAECIWGLDGSRITLDDLRVRERDRFGFNHRGDLMLIAAGKPQGEPMPARKFWTFTAGASHDDNPYGLGLAHSLYWPVFFKRNGVKFWLIFLEQFGMPTAMAKLPPGQYDQAAERNKALLALRQIQTDAGIVIPDSMAIELIEAARSGTADYATLCARMDAAISKVVLSQTMTTDNGSSLAQACRRRRGQGGRRHDLRIAQPRACRVAHLVELSRRQAAAGMAQYRAARGLHRHRGTRQPRRRLGLRTYGGIHRADLRARLAKACGAHLRADSGRADGGGVHGGERACCKAGGPSPRPARPCRRRGHARDEIPQALRRARRAAARPPG